MVPPQGSCVYNKYTNITAVPFAVREWGVGAWVPTAVPFAVREWGVEAWVPTAVPFAVREWGVGAWVPTAVPFAVREWGGWGMGTNSCTLCSEGVGGLGHGYQVLWDIVVVLGS